MLVAVLAYLKGFLDGDPGTAGPAAADGNSDVESMDLTNRDCRARFFILMRCIFITSSGRFHFGGVQPLSSSNMTSEAVGGAGDDTLVGLPTAVNAGGRYRCRMVPADATGAANGSGVRFTKSALRRQSCLVSRQRPIESIE